MNIVYDLFYVSQGDGVTEEAFEGTKEELASHIGFLEERGAHGLEVYQDHKTVYCNGGFNGED